MSGSVWSTEQSVRLNGVQVTTSTGDTATTDASGRYSLTGTVTTAQKQVVVKMQFQKENYEPLPFVGDAGDNPSIVVSDTTTTFANFNQSLQPTVRVQAGDTLVNLLADNGLAVTEPCFPCRIVRVVVPSSGTLEAHVTWSDARGNLNVFTMAPYGRFQAVGTNPREVVATVPVGPGETFLFVGFCNDLDTGTCFSEVHDETFQLTTRLVPGSQ